MATGLVVAEWFACERLSPAFDLDGQQVQVHASAGVAVASGADVDAADLLARADSAMYVAKARGKGSYEVDKPAMGAAAIEGVAVQRGFRAAPCARATISS